MNDTPTSYCYNVFDRNLIDAFTVSGKGFGGTYVGNIPGHVLITFGMINY